MAVALTAGPGSTGHAETATTSAPPQTLANASYRLTASIVDGIVRLRLDDLRTGLCVADGPCLYHAVARMRCNAFRRVLPVVPIIQALTPHGCAPDAPQRAYGHDKVASYTPLRLLDFPHRTHDPQDGVLDRLG